METVITIPDAVTNQDRDNTLKDPSSPLTSISGSQLENLKAVDLIGFQKWQCSTTKDNVHVLIGTEV